MIEAETFFRKGVESTNFLNSQKIDVLFVSSCLNNSVSHNYVKTGCLLGRNYVGVFCWFFFNVKIGT